MRFDFIHRNHTVWPVTVMCRVLKVTRQGFYAWLNREPSPRDNRRDNLAEKAKQIHQQSDGTYGSPRVHQELQAQGETCSENTVASVMRENAIFAGQTKAFKPRTTDSNHDHPIAPNRLNGNFEASRPNEKWVSDITYLPTRHGWCYLATVMDLYSRRIVGWHVADHLKAELVCAAVRMALTHRAPLPGLIFHSDRGVQYAAEQCRSLLRSHGMVQSMSRKGDCYDNAPMESWHGTLKRESVRKQVYADLAEARTAVFEYVEMFYNRWRRHSSLGYVSPQAYECKAIAA
jgi:transposase InsO family protein